jgi:hypothetical protein
MPLDFLENFASQLRESDTTREDRVRAAVAALGDMGSLENFHTPDDLAIWPPELDGGKHNA